MKGFIKIFDLNEDPHYINVSFIIKFVPSSMRNTRGNTAILISGPEKINIVTTNSTLEEVADLINEANQ